MIFRRVSFLIASFNFGETNKKYDQETFISIVLKKYLSNKYWIQERCYQLNEKKSHSSFPFSLSLLFFTVEFK